MTKNCGSCRYWGHEQRLPWYPNGVFHSMCLNAKCEMFTLTTSNDDGQNCQTYEERKEC